MFPVALLVHTCATSLPNIIHVVADDLGWAGSVEILTCISINTCASFILLFLRLDVGYHRLNKTDEVHTPNIDALVQTGLELDRFYVHKICSPTRSALQSGRAPIHVNVQNVLPESVNPKDPIGGYQGIPLNMTCIASQLKKANYQTHLVGKWVG